MTRDQGQLFCVCSNDGSVERRQATGSEGGVDKVGGGVDEDGVGIDFGGVLGPIVRRRRWTGDVSGRGDGVVIY